MNEVEEQTAEIAQTDKFGLGDLVIVGVLAACTFVFQRLWEFTGLLPSVWNEAVAAFGVRPASQLVPGYWSAIASGVHSFMDISSSVRFLQTAGHVALAVLAVGVYALIREILAFFLRIRPQYSSRRLFVSRLAAIVGTVAFVASDAIWTAGQFFSEETVLLLFLVGSLELFFVFLRTGRIRYAYFCSILLGLMAADSPLGLLLPILFIVLNGTVMEKFPMLESELFEPAVMETGKWHMTFLYLAGLLGGIALNCWLFTAHHGLGAVDKTIGDLPLDYVVAYWQIIVQASGLTAWLLFLVLCVTPFVVSALRFPAASDEAQFLSYATGMVFFFCGLMSLSQCASLPALWFWSYAPITSRFMLAVGNFLSALTLSAAVAVLGVDALCRNHERLAQQLFGLVEGDDEQIAVQMADVETELTPKTVWARRIMLCLALLVTLAAIVPGRVKTATRLMLGIIHDVIAQNIREAGDAKYLFTDGNLDAAIELASAEAGGSLKCYSLMGGATPYSAYLRTRNITNEEERFAFNFDTGMGMRTWIRDKPERLKDCAAQMGFDLWKRDGKPLPPMGGVLSRPAGYPDAKVREDAVKAAHALVDRIFAVYARRGGIKPCTDEAIKQAFLNVQWRLARMCKYRGDAEDLAGHAETAIAEAGLAKRLNELNETYQDVVKAVELRNDQLMQKMTPREGLQLALVRADFTMGRVYAETILASDPENPDANFAMGMFYNGERQFSRAEIYLTRCLLCKPMEPAVYNNLAMIQIALGKFRAAEANVRKALELMPESAAIRATEKALREAIEAKKNPPKAPKPAVAAPKN